jgi:DNA-binding MarR family transcriptional regulator
MPVPPDAVLQVCLCHASRRAARALSRIYDAALAPLGLTSGQFALLTAIGAQGPVSIAKLSKIMLMESSTLSRNLAPLRQAGHLTWDGNSGRRAGTIALTFDGEQLLARAIVAWQTVQGGLSQKLGGSAAASLLQMLERTATAAA